MKICILFLISNDLADFSHVTCVTTYVFKSISSSCHVPSQMISCVHFQMLFTLVVSMFGVKRATSQSFPSSKFGLAVQGSAEDMQGWLIHYTAMVSKQHVVLVLLSFDHKMDNCTC